MLFSLNRRRKPGPKGPSAELIHAVVEMKQRNPNWGCPRIAQQIALAFHIPIDKDVAKEGQPGRTTGVLSRQVMMGENPSNRTPRGCEKQSQPFQLSFNASLNVDFQDFQAGALHTDGVGCTLSVGREVKMEIPAKEKYHVRRHSPLPL
jgi:hypothetical protein